MAISTSTDSRHIITANTSLDYYWDHLGGRAYTISLGATVRPASNISVSLGPSWRPGHFEAEYVTAVDDPTATAFYGIRYVVAALDSRTLGLDTRLSWTFSPQMTLELYMQPFLGAAHYSDFKEYVAPRSASLLAAHGD